MPDFGVLATHDGQGAFIRTWQNGHEPLDDREGLLLGARVALPPGHLGRRRHGEEFATLVAEGRGPRNIGRLKPGDLVIHEVPHGLEEGLGADSIPRNLEHASQIVCGRREESVAAGIEAKPANRLRIRKR